ncbi:MAG TPA: Omp28-related outer membrane protein [Flavobacteriales bacterium]
MKKHLSSILLILVAMLWVACDKIDDPVYKFTGDYRSDLYGEPPVFPIVQTPVQNVLLEDFTGHDCGNCPTAHQIAYGILDNNPERVAMVAIHAGTLAQPYPPHYPANWTTPEGSFYLLTQVGVDEMPKGRINRIPSAQTVLSPGLWVVRTNQALAETPTLHLQLETIYSEENQHLSVHVNHQWFDAHSGDYRLVIMVTENKIIAPQLWYNHDPEHVEEYEHNHMLRTTFTGATGRVVASNPTAGTNITNSYTINWNPNWKVENCEVIAFITEGDNGRILNSTHKKIIE